MTELRRNWAAPLDAAVVCLAAACLILYCTLAVLGRAVWTHASPAYQARVPLARPLGYLADGQLLAGGVQFTGCELIRFTAERGAGRGDKRRGAAFSPNPARSRTSMYAPSPSPAAALRRLLLAPSRESLPGREPPFRISRFWPCDLAPCRWGNSGPAAKCLYCSLEDPTAALMAQQARQLGCEAINITPYLSVSRRPSSAAVPTLAFVTMDWIQNRLNLIKEPTTVIVSSGGEVVWYHVGSMAEADAAQGVAAIRRLARQ